MTSNVSIKNAPKDRPGGKKRPMVLLGLVVAVGLALGACSAESGTEALAVGPMGGPIVSAEGQSVSGTVSAGGIEVEGSDIALGRVPLNVTVVPTWTLRNTTAVPVTLTGASIEILEGCCPGEISVDRNIIPPNETAELTFPLQMHAGMDGPHSFIVKVVIGDNEADVLLLGVTGDFRNG